jgi:hypothetical protein
MPAAQTGASPLPNTSRLSKGAIPMGRKGKRHGRHGKRK